MARKLVAKAERLQESDVWNKLSANEQSVLEGCNGHEEDDDFTDYQTSVVTDLYAQHID